MESKDRRGQDLLPSSLTLQNATAAHARKGKYTLAILRKRRTARAWEQIQGSAFLHTEEVSRWNATTFPSQQDAVAGLIKTESVLL